MAVAAAGDFIHFKAHVPLRNASIGNHQWRYYDYGPKAVPPLVCLSGIAGTAEVFYKLILSLSLKGYRVIAADAPPVWSHQEWVNSFEKFLDMVNVHHVHLYGSGIGGFLAQFFAQCRPRRVKSLLLSNTFLDTRHFAASMSWTSLINWAPEFLLKRYILSGIRDGPQDPLIADSIDFVVDQLEKVSKDELASRLTLQASIVAIGQISLPDTVITIMDTNDYCAIPQALKDQVLSRYPGACRAFLKTGGDFPFLSRADEVTVYAQLHLRRVGVEVQPTLKGKLSLAFDNDPLIIEDHKGLNVGGPFHDEQGLHKMGKDASQSSDKYNTQRNRGETFRQLEAHLFPEMSGIAN